MLIRTVGPGYYISGTVRYARYDKLRVRRGTRFKAFKKRMSYIELYILAILG